ncbi:MAG: hypothetical protein LBT40_02300 [Deltaproteobacteria bacterium]|nr:hypothetical protein [Deltaproteobacteria bacterium]
MLLSISKADRTDFFHYWKETIAENNVLALDCNPTSSYSEMIGGINWRYNSGGKNSQQSGICMLFGENCGTPVFPIFYDRHMQDVSNMRNMLDIACKLPFNRISFVLDKSCFSTEDIDIPVNSTDRIPFLATIPIYTNFAKTEIEHARENIDLT